MAGAPTSKPDITRGQANAFIPGAQFFDFENDFVDNSSQFSNMMPCTQQFELSAQKLGLNLHDEIVIYDDFGNFCASRVWFMLISMGFSNVKVLDGGLPQWLSEGFTTQSELCINEVPSSVKLIAAKQIGFVNAEYIQRQLANRQTNTNADSDIQIIDARGAGRFNGTQAEPRANMRSGHIPSSCNIHYASLQYEHQFKAKEQLERLFAAQDVDLTQAIVFSCGSGITACIVAQAAYILGARELYVYDASWSQWGADATLPVEVTKI